MAVRSGQLPGEGKMVAAMIHRQPGKKSSRSAFGQWEAAEVSSGEQSVEFAERAAAAAKVINFGIRGPAGGVSWARFRLSVSPQQKGVIFIWVDQCLNDDRALGPESFFQCPAVFARSGGS